MMIKQSYNPENGIIPKFQTKLAYKFLITITSKCKLEAVMSDTIMFN
jgi:hypothetical protein